MAKLRNNWKRSTRGRTPLQGRGIKALGLHRLYENVYHEDTPQIRGMINKISHLLEYSVEE